MDCLYYLLPLDVWFVVFGNRAKQSGGDLFRIAEFARTGQDSLPFAVNLNRALHSGAFRRSITLV